MLRLVTRLLVGSCLLAAVALRAEPTNHSLPSPHIDATTATVWSCCSLVGVSYLQELYSNGDNHRLEVLHSSATSEAVTVEFITSISSSPELEQMGLRNCTLLAKMEDLIASELARNWHTLKHHVQDDFRLPDKLRGVINRQKTSIEEFEHNVLRRSVSSGDDDKCPEGVCDKEISKEKDDFDVGELFKQYHNLSSLYHWYQRLSEDYPHIVTLNKTIGKTYYEREIIALHFTDRNEQRSKPKIYLQCLLHSREWISGSVCMYLSYRLATPHPSDITLLRLLKEVEFVIVPVANPDGYYATWVQYPKYRLWRKNVQPLEGSECAGVDLNRNFDSHWDQDTYSQSDDPCSELYHGHVAGSELEVQVLTAYIKSLGRVVGAIDFHSYHQKILYPPAFSGEDVGDLSVIQEAAERMATTASGDGHLYTPHKMYDLYSAAGTFADWLLDYRNDPSEPDSDDLVPLTVELRPRPNNTTTIYTGFLLPTSEILPTCREMYSSLLVFSQFLLEKSSQNNE